MGLSIDRSLSVGWQTELSAKECVGPNVRLEPSVQLIIQSNQFVNAIVSFLFRFGNGARMLITMPTPQSGPGPNLAILCAMRQTTLLTLSWAGMIIWILQRFVCSNGINNRKVRDSRKF